MNAEILLGWCPALKISILAIIFLIIWMFYLCLPSCSWVILQHQTCYICRVLHQTWKQCGWSLLLWSCSQRRRHLQGNQLWGVRKCSGFYRAEWLWSQGGLDSQGSQNQLENKGWVASFLTLLHSFNHVVGQHSQRLLSVSSLILFLSLLFLHIQEIIYNIFKQWLIWWIQLSHQWQWKWVGVLLF